MVALRVQTVSCQESHVAFSEKVTEVIMIVACIGGETLRVIRVQVGDCGPTTVLFSNFAEGCMSRTVLICRSTKIVGFSVCILYSDYR